MQRFSKPLAITLAILVMAVLSYVVIKNGIHNLEDNRTPQSTVTTQPKPATAAELLKLVNEQRSKAGVAPLVLDERLNQSAQRKADDMAKYDYFDHVSPHDGKHGYEYINDVGISCKTDGENLSWNTDGILTAKDAIDWWIQSKPHHEAMLNPKDTLTGFGITDSVAVEHFCE